MALMSTGRCSPEPCARMQQHVLDDRIRALAVLHDLVEVAAQHLRELGDLGAGLGIELRALERILQFVDQLDGNRREVVDEIERVLDLVGDAGGELAERGELLGLHQAVLRGPQFLQRLRQFGGALLDFLFEADRRLLLFRHELIEGDRIVAEYFDGARHFGDLIAATGGNHDVAPAADDGAHAARQGRQTRHHIAAHIKPSDQDRADQAERDDHTQSKPAKFLDRLRPCRCRRDALLRCGDQGLHGIAQLDRQDGVFDRQAPPFLAGLQFDLPRGDDARIADRAGPQTADGSDQRERDVGVKARHKTVDAPNRPFGLISNGNECGRRIGVAGADQRLERDRGLLLDLFEWPEIADRRDEAINGGEPLLRRAACRTERALQGENMALQFVKFRGPDGAELVVGVERVANQRRLAICGSDPLLHRSFQGL